MFALEIETTIDQTGMIHLPDEYRRLYGKMARIIVLTPEESSETSDFYPLSVSALEKVWNHEEDDIYDQL